MDILLIPAPNVDRGRLVPYVPYGLLSLQALAPRLGATVSIPDLAGLATPGSFSSSEELAGLLASAIDPAPFDAVGLSTMCSSFHHTLNLARALKQRSPGTRLWLGGPHASVAPAAVLRSFSEIEAVFVGEGESTFADVLRRGAASPRSCLHGVPGVWTREAAPLPRPLIPDLDCLPFVDEADDFLPALEAAKRDEPGESVPFEIERGCSGRCVFCSTTLFWGRRVRRKSLARVIAEMHRLRRRTGMTSFTMLGDNLAGPHSWLVGFCEAMSKQAPDYEWYCSLKLDRLQVADLDTLWRGGCRGFFVGVESASQATLDRIGKDVDLRHELEVVRAAIDHGFLVTTSFIIGFPWETEEDVSLTCRLHGALLRDGVERSMVSVLSPLPGTRIASEHAERLKPYIGLSDTALDGLPYGAPTRELTDRCPELFTQLGHLETPTTRASLAAAAAAARMVSDHHWNRRRQSEA